MMKKNILFLSFLLSFFTPSIITKNKTKHKTKKKKSKRSRSRSKINQQGTLSQQIEEIQKGIEKYSKNNTEPLEKLKEIGDSFSKLSEKARHENARIALETQEKWKKIIADSDERILKYKEEENKKREAEKRKIEAQDEKAKQLAKEFTEKIDMERKIQEEEIKRVEAEGKNWGLEQIRKEIIMKKEKKQ